MSAPVIRWDSGTGSVPLTCPVCRAEADKDPVLTYAEGGVELELFRCRSCQTKFYKDPMVETYGGGDEDFWRAYVEVGAGIDTMIRPLLRLRARPRSLLEAGCGFGFAIDFWRRTFRESTVVGFEPGEYGEMGRRLLGAPIRPEPVVPAEPGAGPRYDVVFATEVIEHVEDPAAFVRTLAGHLADGGTLILTTPDADYVEPEGADPNALVGVLSARSHRFLLTRRGLADLFRAEGFEHVEIRTEGERLVGWASRRPLELAEPQEEAALYERYLELLLADPGVEGPLRLGVAYRLFKALVNRGEFARAEERETDLLDALVTAYGPFEELERGILADGGQAEGVASRPYNLGCIAYFRGALRAGQGRPHEASDLFARAFEILRRETAEVRAVAVLEAAGLLWRARLEQALALQAAGRAGVAWTVCSGIGGIPTLPPPSPALRLRAAVEAAKIALFDGEWDRSWSSLEAAVASLPPALREDVRDVGWGGLGTPDQEKVGHLPGRAPDWVDREGDGEAVYATGWWLFCWGALELNLRGRPGAAAAVLAAATEYCGRAAGAGVVSLESVGQEAGRLAAEARARVGG